MVIQWHEFKNKSKIILIHHYINYPGIDQDGKNILGRNDPR
jgi:hypothetical protein